MVGGGEGDGGSGRGASAIAVFYGGRGAIAGCHCSVLWLGDDQLWGSVPLHGAVVCYGWGGFFLYIDNW